MKQQPDMDKYNTEKTALIYVPCSCYMLIYESRTRKSGLHNHKRQACQTSINIAQSAISQWEQLWFNYKNEESRVCETKIIEIGCLINETLNANKGKDALLTRQCSHVYVMCLRLYGMLK